MKDKKIIIIAVVLVIIVSLILLFGGNKKKKSDKQQEINLSEYTEAALEARTQELEVHNEIKKAIDNVEETYQVAHSNHSAYKRSDFYNEQRLNETMSNGTIEFVDANEVSTENLYDISGKKIESVSARVSNLANKSSFQTGNLLLRCKSSMGQYTFYYLVTVGNKGLESYEYIFYSKYEAFTEIELEYDTNN